MPKAKGKRKRESQHDWKHRSEAIDVEKINIEMSKQERENTTKDMEKERELTFYLLYISTLPPSGEVESARDSVCPCRV